MLPWVFLVVLEATFLLQENSFLCHPWQ